MQPSQETMSTSHTNLSKGEQLKKIREERGISLDTIHEATKIPLDALKAIEEGYNVRTLSPFYYRGFIKIYAAYLNIDATDILDDFKKVSLPKQTTLAEDNFKFNIEGWFTKTFTKQRKQRIVIVIGIGLSLFLIFKAVTFLIHLFSSNPSRTTKKVSANKTPGAALPQNTEDKKKIKVQVVTPQTQTAEPVQSPQTNPAVPAAVTSTPVTKDVTLTVRAKQDSWLRVKSDGNVVFQSTLQRGSVETWIADDQIEISGRNISQLEFELNGKWIGSLGRNDRKAKLVTVTKDGLKVSN
ncbi:MAG: helix-turn-helix domain-containing protein [Candidatus Omnitrophica bacterium]|nr:helix-turn-helix domain-containing protein [Candidatus Omnitrophota bacterium]